MYGKKVQKKEGYHKDIPLIGDQKLFEAVSLNVTPDMSKV